AYTTGYPYPNLFTTTPGALDTGSDKRIGITKLNPQGNQRIYAARFGSSGGDSSTDIDVDSSGNVYVTGTTNCAAIPPCDFPILNAPQPNYSGNGDMFVSKLNASGSALIYSTYIGGSSSEHPNSIDVDPSGNAYLTGYTFSFNFPTTPGAFDSTFACVNPPFCRPDAFVTKIAANGGSFVYSTYLGGVGEEEAWGIAVDDAGSAYVAGETDGRFSGAPDEGFPTTPGAYKMFGSVEAFVTKLNPAGSALVYSTLLGGSNSSCGDERARGIDVDRLGHAYVVGLTTCNNFPVANALQSSPSSFQPEGFVTKFNPAGSGLVYSSYLGGPRYDEAFHVAVDYRTGAAYITGTTSGGFQLITPGAYDTTWNCGQFCEHPDDIFVMKIDGELAPLRNKVADFDGDGRSDISVYRNGTWYIQQSTAGFVAAQFGVASDKITPADYDGDGKTDFGVFRDGTWYLQRSTAGFTAIQFGAAGDVPQPGDFDGDAKADLAVFRPTDGTWYLQQSANGFRAVQFGQNGDKPVAADFDGDGKTDAAVYRGGVWYVLQSRDGFKAIQFGIASDKTVAADYDGDGKADFVVFRDGTWYLQRSQAGFAAFQFGQAGDVPVPADYDGDGRADYAVYRGGAWYLQQSASGFAAAQFGQSNDVPVPSASVP
ncbi:MAG: SBBP repeat-containing protein, partial [Acidobacteriota bacterium]|nr:SBBP repeat-containing protein [Acidobacteriota bacterium]